MDEEGTAVAVKATAAVEIPLTAEAVHEENEPSNGHEEPIIETKQNEEFTSSFADAEAAVVAETAEAAMDLKLEHVMECEEEVEEE